MAIGIQTKLFMTFFNDKQRPTVAVKGRRVAVAVVLVLLTFTTGGCGVLAAPCRIGSAVIKMVPVVGHAAAVPTDACAAVIDP